MPYMVDKKKDIAIVLTTFSISRVSLVFVLTIFLSTHRTSYLRQYSKYDDLCHDVNKPEES